MDWLIGVLVPLRKDKDEELDDNEAGLLEMEIAILTALAAWRPTKGIYCFDPELSEELMSTPITGDLPCDVFFHLPEWCVYVETPQQEKNGAYGFFAYLDIHSSPTQEKQLSLHLIFDTVDYLVHSYVPLRKAPLTELLDEVYRTVPASTRMSIHALLQPAISLLLYVCATNAEFGAQQPRYAELFTATVIITAEKDRIVSPKRHARALAAMLPAAELVIAPDTGHMPHRLRTDLVIAAIRRVNEMTSASAAD